MFVVLAHDAAGRSGRTDLGFKVLIKYSTSGINPPIKTSKTRL